MSFTPNNFILNGFDRSGSSAIARTLARHPQIELIFQPFNSGSIRQKMYQILDDSKASVEDRLFFEELEKGRFMRNYIVSSWHTQHSSTQDFVEGQLHLIKTTLNHMSMKWMSERFPSIEVWGIFREPMDILASITRNDFQDQWYTDAFDQLRETVKQEEELCSIFQGFEDEVSSPTQITAYLIAVRSYFFFKHLPKGKVIIYERFRENASVELQKIVQYFHLEPFEFGSKITMDLNVIGKEFSPEQKHAQLLSVDDISFAERIFAPMQRLVQHRHAINN